jgi:hypothetical protein
LKPTDLSDPRFDFWKNPYHLFAAVLQHELQFNQRQSAVALTSALKKRHGRGEVHMDVGRFSTIVQEDYLDILERDLAGMYARHFAAMNEILREKMTPELQKVLQSTLEGSPFQLLNLEHRKALERAIEYAFTSRDRELEREYSHIRGIWQLFHASVLAEDMRNERQHHIRAAVLVFFGFLPSHSETYEKARIKALIVGRSSVWRAHAWINGEKLFVMASDPRTNEDQVFIFNIPPLRTDPLAHRRFNRMRGIMSGTVLDEQYDGRYPVVSAPAVARKLPEWSRWLETHHWQIGNNFIQHIRNGISCDYFPPEDLIKQSRSGNDEASDDPRTYEYFVDLRNVVGELFEKETEPKRLIRPFFIEPTPAKNG